MSPLSGGAAVVGKGRGQLGKPPALAPGCCRGDNRGRGSPFASLTPTPVVAPLGSPLSEGAGRRLLAAAPLGPDCATLRLRPLPAKLFSQRLWGRAREAHTPRRLLPWRCGARTARVAVGWVGAQGGGERVWRLAHGLLPSRGGVGGGFKVILAGVGGRPRGEARGGRSYPIGPLVPPTPPLSTLAGSWVL